MENMMWLLLGAEWWGAHWRTCLVQVVIDVCFWKKNRIWYQEQAVGTGTATNCCAFDISSLFSCLCSGLVDQNLEEANEDNRLEHALVKRGAPMLLDIVRHHHIPHARMSRVMLVTRHEQVSTSHTHQLQSF